MKEYKVSIYNTKTDLEELVYFTSKHKAIKYAKKMYNNITIAVVFDYNGQIIYNSEDFD